MSCHLRQHPIMPRFSLVKLLSREMIERSYWIRLISSLFSTAQNVDALKCCAGPPALRNWCAVRELNPPQGFMRPLLCPVSYPRLQLQLYMHMIVNQLLCLGICTKWCLDECHLPKRKKQSDLACVPHAHQAWVVACPLCLA